MKKLFVSLILFLIIQKVKSQVTVVDSIQFEGAWRNYRIHLPPGFNAGHSLPLVFNFHGLGSNALEQELYTEFDNVSDTGNFLVCYPNGLNNSWNILSGFPNDPGFVDTLISIFNSQYNINIDRVYATGLSNGAFLSNLLACQMSNKIAAIAPVAGTNANIIQANCVPARMTPVLYIHGTADGVVDYNGTTTYSSAAALLQLYASRNNCGTTDTVAVPNTDSTDGCTADIITWHGCDSNKLVIHYRINNGGHTWPDGLVNIGVTNRDFNASGVIWDFFNRVASVTGTEEIPVKSASVFPNPFSKKFTIDTILEDYSASVYSSDGRLVYGQKKLSGKTVIDLPGTVEGLYVLKINSDRLSETYRIVRYN
jgi:polyhydroxybutyrate depolymerase